MYNKLIGIFIECSESFIDNEQGLILSGVSERCLCGSLMLIIRKNIDNTEFKDYYSDIEYNRNVGGRVKTIIDDNMEEIDITCDLIIHSRGKNDEQDNLIAIEMKRDTHRPDEKEKDRIRLRALTKPKNGGGMYRINEKDFPKHVCGYVIGVFYEISIAHRQIILSIIEMGIYTIDMLEISNYSKLLISKNRKEKPRLAGVFLFYS